MSACRGAETGGVGPVSCRCARSRRACPRPAWALARSADPFRHSRTVAAAPGPRQCTSAPDADVLPAPGRYWPRPAVRAPVAPHSRVDLLNRVGEGLVWSPERWGWTPSWAKPPVRSDINATCEKSLMARTFDRSGRTARCFVPTAGTSTVQSTVRKPSRPITFAGATANRCSLPPLAVLCRRKRAPRRRRLPDHYG